MTPPGSYKITKSNVDGSLATLGHEPDSPVVVTTGYAGAPHAEVWILEELSDKNVALKNQKSNLYISFEGDPSVNKELVVQKEPRAWRLQNSGLPDTFFIVVPGGPVGTEELALDSSLLRIFPLRAALRPLRSDDDSVAWKFIKVGE